MRELPFKLGTLGGVVACTLPHIRSEQLLTTCVLAGVGAMVSFLTTLVLRTLLRKLGRWWRTGP